MKSSILNKFFLISKVVFNIHLDYIYKYSKVIKILSKKSFKLNPRSKFYLALIFILIFIKTNLPIKKNVINELYFKLVVSVILK